MVLLASPAIVTRAGSRPTHAPRPAGSR